MLPKFSVALSQPAANFDPIVDNGSLALAKRSLKFYTLLDTLPNVSTNLDVHISTESLVAQYFIVSG